MASADRAVLAISSLSLVAAALCDVAIPHFSASALSAIVTSDTPGFHSAMRGLFGFSVGAAAFTGLRGAFFWIAGARVVARLRLKLFSNLLRQEVGG